MSSSSVKAQARTLVDTIASTLARSGGGGSSPAGPDFIQGGNAFLATAVLGTTDHEHLNIITDNTVKATFMTSDVFQLSRAGVPFSLLFAGPGSVDATGGLIVGGGVSTTGVTLGQVGITTSVEGTFSVAGGVIDLNATGPAVLDSTSTVAIGGVAATAITVGRDGGPAVSVAGGAAGTASMMVANNSATNTSDGVYITAGTNAGTGAHVMEFFRPDATVIGSITQNAAATVAYNVSSDARLKKDIKSFTNSALELVKRLNVREYKYKSDVTNRNHVGFVAQELAEIWPEAVTPGGVNEKVSPWMVDYAKLTPLLVKVVQELSIKLEEVSRTNSELKKLIIGV